MNAMQMLKLAALRTAQAELSDADFLTWGATPIYTESPTPVLVTYQKLRALSTKEKVDAVAAFVSKADPIGHQLLFTTGVDVNFPDAKDLLKMLPNATGGIITDADLETFRDIGRTATRPFDGLGEVTQADLDALPRLTLLAALEASNRDRYNANVLKLDRLRGDVKLAIPADISGLDAMEGAG